MSEASSITASEAVLQSENRKYYEFINLGLFLAVLTGIEIVIIFFPWNAFLIFWILVVLSVIKFACVIAWFMHLIYDKILLSVIFLAAMVLASGTVAALMLLFSGKHVDFDAITVGMMHLSGLL